MDPKQIVAQGYDRIAERYLAWVERAGHDVRARYARLLADGLEDGARVLELGCGAGIPIARQLAERFVLTGVDISARQIELARQNVPTAAFIHGDMTEQRFPTCSFDAVSAFYVLNHLPREELEPLFGAIVSWLRPGGLVVMSFGTGSDPGSVEDDWLGVPMYFSSFDARTNLELVRRGGLAILRAREETIDEDGKPATFLWIVAEKPGTNPARREHVGLPPA